MCTIAVLGLSSAGKTLFIDTLSKMALPTLKEHTLNEGDTFPTVSYLLRMELHPLK